MLFVAFSGLNQSDFFLWLVTYTVWSGELYRDFYIYSKLYLAGHISRDKLSLYLLLSLNDLKSALRSYCSQNYILKTCIEVYGKITSIIDDNLHKCMLTVTVQAALKYIKSFLLGEAFYCSLSNNLRELRRPKWTVTNYSW